MNFIPDKPFLDTNILVYAKLRDENSIDKSNSAINLIKKINTHPVTSVQVLNEFSSVLIKHNVSDQIIKDTVQELIDNSVVIAISLEMIRETWRIRDKYHFSYWDSMIVAAAIKGRCNILYTEDLQHGQVIDNRLEIFNPFL
ncbi:MAG: PIN domain-containing protein [Desulfatiglans sp.]|jgi:predicted nucleic acid-binding protein|nr:PIN domain-containing protein [Desulfatiglans sp.]